MNAIRLPRKYRKARRHVLAGRLSRAADVYEQLEAVAKETDFAALIQNDLGVLEALCGHLEAARSRFLDALTSDPGLEVAANNLALLEREFPEFQSATGKTAGDAWDSRSAGIGITEDRPRRIAVVSLLFNWPSTGGGTVHTTETAKFLAEAGYEVRHFSACYKPWDIGIVQEEPPFPVTTLEFREDDWHADGIATRFREAVDEFQPDAVIITDSWNAKPLLANALKDYRCFLRLAAQECLCPLNNLRLLFKGGRPHQCPENQLASPDVCRACISLRGSESGGLHQAERALARFESSSYPEQLQAAFSDAEGVLVVNPEIARLVKPHAQHVHVIPSGFDPARFPWPWKEDSRERDGKPFQIAFAGLHSDFIKGFHVLRNACRLLWQHRQDFEVVLTGDAPADAEPFLRSIGWQTQAALPAVLRTCDVTVVPPVSADALGRTAVEAMGVGRPVIASRIGGLPFVVEDYKTGLLFEPGDAEDLARKLTQLMDDAELRVRLGAAGRKQFEKRFRWPDVIARQYVPLLGEPVVSAA